MTSEQRAAARFDPIWAPRGRNLDLLQHNAFAPLKPDFSRQPTSATAAVKIGRQWFRQLDNGRANVLVPAADPWVSPAVLAARRAAIERASYIARSPLAGVGYSSATLAGASPRTREMAMVLGGAIDSALLAASPLGAAARRPAPAPTISPPMRTAHRAPIRFGPTNAIGQASYGSATVAKPMLGTGRKPKRGLTLPGLLDSAKMDRGHLIAEAFGGTANSPRQAVALHPYVNRGAMSTFEKSVTARARAGEVLEYFAQPLYGPKALWPSAVVLSAQGSRGVMTSKVLQNRDGRRK